MGPMTLIVALTTFYVLVALIVAFVHDQCLASEGEARPVTSIILGVVWPLVVVVLTLVFMAIVILETIDTFRVGKS